MKKKLQILRDDWLPRVNGFDQLTRSKFYNFWMHATVLKFPPFRVTSHSDTATTECYSSLLIVRFLLLSDVRCRNWKHWRVRAVRFPVHLVNSASTAREPCPPQLNTSNVRIPQHYGLMNRKCRRIKSSWGSKVTGWTWRVT